MRDIQDETGIARLEDRLITVSKILQLRSVPRSKVAKLANAAASLAEAVRAARYI